MSTVSPLHLRDSRINKCCSLHTIPGLLCKVRYTHRFLYTICGRVFTKVLGEASEHKKSRSTKQKWVGFCFPMIFFVLPKHKVYSNGTHIISFNKYEWASSLLSGPRNEDMTKSLSLRNCLIEEIGQVFRLPWPWAAIKSVRGVYVFQRLENSVVAKRPGRSPWRLWHWAGWWKSWMMGWGTQVGSSSDFGGIELDSPSLILGRSNSSSFHIHPFPPGI